MTTSALPVDTDWTRRNWWGALAVRCNVGRMHYTIEPGLYTANDPGPDAPVFVSANYKLSFDHLRRALKGQPGWILVLDTKGINVWCAAGKGTFGTEELVRSIRVADLANQVSHRTLIVPQLGAPGVAAHQVTRETGFRIVYGPIRAQDIPAFLRHGMKADADMRRVRFGILDRLAVAPVELALGAKYAFITAAIFALPAGWQQGNWTWATFRTEGTTAVLSTLGGFLFAGIAIPALLPSCLDEGDSPATVSKKLRALKRMFRLAVDRQQLDYNPLRAVAVPTLPSRKVRVFTNEECRHLVQVAHAYNGSDSFRWGLIIATALATGMRRGELLNCAWQDIDFATGTIEVSPKKDAERTWEWHIKDTERRTLPLPEKLVSLLAEHQAQQPEGYPYVFIPPARYDHIQMLRQRGKWSYRDSRLKVMNNFNRTFKKILKQAGIKSGQFHDLRRTALSNLFAGGMSEFEVMKIGGILALGQRTSSTWLFPRA